MKHLTRQPTNWSVLSLRLHIGEAVSYLTLAYGYIETIVNC